MKLDWWPNPVTTEGRTTIEFNIGDTLDQVLGRVVSLDNHEIAVFVNGAPVLRESWNVVVLEPNDIISARVIMTDGDGGSNPIAVVLSIALLVAAPFLAARILGTTAALVQGTISGAALTAGIGFVGLLVINALFPPRLPDVKQAGQLPRQYSISGGANRARPYEPIQLLLGSHRLFPDLAAKEYTEYDEEGDQFLFQLFDFGIGKLDVGTLKIGDTDLSDYASVMTNTSADQSLVYGDVDTVVGGEFDAENLVAISRTLGAMTTQIGFDIVSQYFKVSGSDIDGLTTIFKLEYKLVTDTSWTSQNVSIDTPDGSEGRVPKRGTYTYEVDSGNYDVRASVMSSVNTEDAYTFQAAVHFKGYQDTTANWKGRNPLAVKIKATGQLYGRVGTLNAECKQLIDHWNGSSWVANSETSNPGDILYKYLRGWYDSDSRLIAGMGLSTNRIDEESIKLFVTFCNNNGLECNVVIEDGRDHAETLRLICQCGWAAIDLQSGKWGVLYEDFGRALSAVVNPDNVIAGSMTVVYENEALADEIIGDFIDSASDYEQNQIRRTVPNKVNPKRPTVIPLEGIVKGEHAAKELNRAVAAQAYHIRSITWEMDLAEGMPIARGDVVGISHGLIGSGKGGRFTNIDSTRLKVTPSRTYSDSDAGSIWIWDLNDNVFSGTFTVNSSGELVLSAALPNPPANLYDNPTAYRFMTFLTASALEKVRIIGKEPASSTKLRFIARDEVDDYYNYRTSDLTWTPVTRRLLGNPSSPITAFSVSQDQNGVRIFAWALHHSRIITRYQIRYGTMSNTFDDMLPLHEGFLVSSPFESLSFPGAGSYRFGLVGLSEDGIRTTPVYRDFTFDAVNFGGLGIEFIFASTLNPSVLANQRPLNSWGYKAGGIANGLSWADSAINLTETNPYLWQCQRAIEGAPEDGSEVTDMWSSPVITGRYGNDGIAGNDGIGQDGADGEGVEYIFTSRSAPSIPISKRPSNTWGFDSPGTIDNQVWTDGAPAINSSNPYLFRSERAVLGSPAVGTAVVDLWSIPVIVGRFGIDGLDGEDGGGVEFIFTVYSSSSLPTSRRPLNTWGYDSPGTRGGQTWYDGAPNLTNDLPFLYLSERAVPGSPAVGTAVVDLWSIPVIVGRLGVDGDPASRGSGWFREVVTQSEQSQLGTLTVSLNSTWITRADALTPGENIKNDIVTFWRGESFSSSWYWSGTSWLRMLKFIGAETILAIDISAITGSFADLNVTGRLAAEHIDSDVRNWFSLWKGSTLIASTSWTSFTIPSIAMFYSIVVEVAYSTTQHTETFYENLNFSSTVTSIQGAFLAFAGDSNSDDFIKFQKLSNTSVRMRPETGSCNVKGIWGINNPLSASSSDPADSAPSWADNTGNARSWTQNSAISGITVPAASGTPTPTYSASGLPSGLNFNTSSRQITGTPTGIGSGTITVIASNSEGSDTWTMPYTTSAAALQAPGTPSTPTRTSRTSSSLTLATVAGSGGAATLYRWRYSTNSTVSDTDPMVTSTGPSVTIPSLNANDNYWIDVRAENSAGNSAYSGDLATATLAAPVMNVAPNWADDTGNARSWTQNSAISGITVPAATGTPTPTYSASGLPSGVSFDAGTRGISGTPTGIGSGTITITATNSEGTAAWTMDYSTSAEVMTMTTTDTDKIWCYHGLINPSDPTGGTNVEDHFPPACVGFALAASPTLYVYSWTRTRTYTDGVFTSATAWGNRQLVFAPSN